MKAFDGMNEWMSRQVLVSCWRYSHHVCFCFLNLSWVHSQAPSPGNGGPPCPSSCFNILLSALNSTSQLTQLNSTNEMSRTRATPGQGLGACELMDTGVHGFVTQLSEQNWTLSDISWSQKQHRDQKVSVLIWDRLCAVGLTKAPCGFGLKSAMTSSCLWLHPKPHATQVNGLSK